MLQIIRRIMPYVISLCFLSSVSARAESGFYVMTASIEAYMKSPDYDLSLLPGEYQSILVNYKAGKFRLALLQLQELITIGLPDGRLDGYLFITGECYRSLGLDKYAMRFYRRLSDEYPESPFYGQALYRLSEDSYKRLDENGSIFYLSLLLKHDSVGEMANAAKFTEGKRLYRKGLFAEAEKMMSSISDGSPLRHASLFVRSLCALELNNYEKAILQLDAVIKRTPDPVLKDEALLVTGQIYIRLKRMDKAEELLMQVPQTSARLGEALIFLSQIKLAKNDLVASIALGEQLLKINNGEYMFEAAMVLESAYLRTRQDDKINNLRTYLEISVRRKKLVFDLYKELDLLADRHTSFGVFSQDVSDKLTTLQERRSVNAVYDSVSVQHDKLRNGALKLLAELDADAHISGGSGVYELRFLEYVDKQTQTLSARADSLSSLVSAMTTGRTGERDPAVESRLMQQRDAVIANLRHFREMRDDVRTHALSSNPAFAGAEEAQAKFVDWSMMHLDQMKERLREVYRELGRLSRSATPAVKEEGKPSK
ncbi:MAG: tetratricopeptide repeat protein [Fibrobacteres bacterium]|nr:tetratricopeptide repeat protein [Fibrobacterota bacterium]